ncbi:MAG: TraR/DksA C4-type zinc finger protein [Actinobacteria bacterium]|nr:TraR/DksA C4-type zinc finger protein [Actinomycetota bacterium]
MAAIDGQLRSWAHHYRVDAGTVRQRLQAERASAIQLLEQTTSDWTALASASTGSNADDEHDPEGATIAFEREQLTAMRSRARNYVLELDAALARLGDDCYGRCERCDALIGTERLEALPTTRLCVYCSARCR